MIVIELTGKKRSGKGIVASILEKTLHEKYGYYVTRLSFAQPLKRFVNQILRIEKGEEFSKDKITKQYVKNLISTFSDYFDIRTNTVGLVEKLYDKFHQHEKVTGRTFLQILGTDFARENISEIFWVYRCFRRIREYQQLDMFDFVIIDDYRFPNEDLSRFHIEHVYKFRIKGGITTDNHISETLIDQLDVDKELPSIDEFNDLLDFVNTNTRKIIKEVLKK